jgi:glycosyltransferase involved in cell wall biosynthesis
MYHSLALINPSLFEGWSSTVEEAKSLGKMILLSDIPVHREQNPQRSLFFGCNDPRELADALIQVQKRYDPGEEHKAKEQARAVLPMRRDEFYRTYEQIVLEIISK